MFSVETTYAVIDPPAGWGSPEPVAKTPNDMSKRVAAESVRAQQHKVGKEDESADPDSDSSIKKESAEGVPPKKDQEDESYIQKVAMEILQDERKCGLAPIAVLPVLADGAGGRIEKESPVVGLSIVVARDPESQRPNQN